MLTEIFTDIGYGNLCLAKMVISVYSKILLKEVYPFNKKEIREFYFVGLPNQVIFLGKCKKGGIFGSYLEWV